MLKAGAVGAVGSFFRYGWDSNGLTPEEPLVD